MSDNSAPNLSDYIFPAMCLPFIVAAHYYIVGDFFVSLRTSGFPYVHASDVKYESYVRKGSEGPEDRIRVKYHYRVRGKTYAGNQFRFAAGRTKDASPSWTTELPLKVFYNPSQPSQSALAAGNPFRDSIPLLFIVAFHASWLAVFVDTFAKIPTDSISGQSDSLPIGDSQATPRIHLGSRNRFARRMKIAWGCTIVCFILAFSLANVFPDTLLIGSMWGVCLFAWARVFVSVRSSNSNASNG